MNPRQAVTRRSQLRAHWRGWLAVLLGLLILLLAPAFAHAQGASVDSVPKGWTATGDDNTVGTASLYEMRFSTSPITLGNWNSARAVSGMPAPLIAGTRQTVRVRQLSRDTTYYFAIRTQDDASNWSGLSNVVQWDWLLDTAPPATPTSARASRSGVNAVVQWNANSEPDLAGYSVYRATTSGGSYTKLNGPLVTGLSYTDTNVPSGETMLFYRVSATDASGNESARTSPVSVTFITESAAQPDWSMGPGYPNPSRTGESVCVPVVIPSGGAGNAAIEIEDSGGHRVRYFTVSSASTCAEGVLWDGRNDGGREVAPGVYRAWVVLGERRDYIKLVRQP